MRSLPRLKPDPTSAGQHIPHVRHLRQDTRHVILHQPTNPSFLELLAKDQTTLDPTAIILFRNIRPRSILFRPPISSSQQPANRPCSITAHDILNSRCSRTKEKISQEKKKSKHSLVLPHSTFSPVLDDEKELICGANSAIRPIVQRSNAYAYLEPMLTITNIRAIHRRSVNH
jgi:hypothetical protein